MQRASVKAPPTPHSQACETFRAAGCATIASSSGRPFLVDALERCTGPAPPVSQHRILRHRPERRCVRITHRFRCPRGTDVGSVHVAAGRADVSARDAGRSRVPDTPAAMPDRQVGRPSGHAGRRSKPRGAFLRFAPSVSKPMRAEGRASYALPLRSEERGCRRGESR